MPTQKWFSVIVKPDDQFAPHHQKISIQLNTISLSLNVVLVGPSMCRSHDT
jgi:hypothetical protein